MTNQNNWLFVSNMFPSESDPSYGAFVLRSLEDLQANGICISNVAVIAGRRGRFTKIATYIKYYLRILQLGIFGNSRFVYAHYASHHCLPLALLAIYFKKKTVLHIHGDDLAVRHGLIRFMSRIGQKSLINSAKAIVVPSPFFRDLLLQIYPDIDSSKVFVSPSSGVELDTYLIDKIDSKRSYWNEVKNNPEINIGYIGRIEDDKGWRLLLDALQGVSEQYEKIFNLHIWGGGSGSHELQKRLSGKMQFNCIYHGNVPHTQIPEAHAQFDFHVIPSARESLGLSAIEGLASGHIVICSKIRPFTDYTTDGTNAIHFDRSIEALQSALIRAFAMSASEMDSMSKAARSVALEFDRKVVSQKLTNAIKDITWN